MSHSQVWRHEGGAQSLWGCQEELYGEEPARKQSICKSLKQKTFMPEFESSMIIFNHEQLDCVYALILNGGGM